MNKNLLAAVIFIGSGAISYGAYQLLNPCLGLAMPDCALVTKSNISRDGAATLSIAPLKSDNALSFDISSNIMCPFNASVSVSFDRSSLSDWMLGDLIEAAYVPPQLVRVQNGQAKLDLTPSSNPSLGIIPPGAYNVRVDYTTLNQNQRQQAFFERSFGVKPGSVEGSTKVNFMTDKTTADKYGEYLSTWLRLVSKAQREGVTKANLKTYEAEFGKAQITETDGQIVYTFPDRQHTLITNTQGQLVQAKRYSFETPQAQEGQ